MEQVNAEPVEIMSFLRQRFTDASLLRFQQAIGRAAMLDLVSGMAGRQFSFEGLSDEDRIWEERSP